MKKLFYIVSFVFLAGCQESKVSDPGDAAVIPAGEKTLKSEVVAELAARQAMHVNKLVKSGDMIAVGHQGGEYTLVGPCQALRVTDFDFRTGKLREKQLGMQTRAGEEEILTVLLPEEKNHLWAERIGDLILATGLYEEGRYLLYDPQTRETLYQLTYPNPSFCPEASEYTKSILYASNVLKVRPDQQAFVCADMYSGTIDFCRLNGHRIERVTQQCYSYPMVYIRGKNQTDVAYSRDNRFGFTDVTVTQDRIYTLYSGRTFREGKYNFQHCRTLMVFDWEGTLLHTYTLDTPLTHVTYDSDQKALYGLGYTPEPAVLKVTIP